MKAKEFSGQKIICLNRKASFNYFFLELIEAGIALKGSEVKSIRDGKVSIADSYAADKNGEISTRAEELVGRQVVTTSWKPKTFSTSEWFRNIEAVG